MGIQKKIKQGQIKQDPSERFIIGEDVTAVNPNFEANAFALGEEGDITPNPNALDRINPEKRIEAFIQSGSDYLDLGNCKLNALPKNLFEKIPVNRVKRLNLGNFNVFLSSRNLLANGRTQDAISEIYEFLAASQSQEEDMNTVILIGARFQQWQNLMIKGIISLEESNIEHLKITKGLLDFINDIESSLKNDFSSSTGRQSLSIISELKNLKSLSLNNISLKSIDFFSDTSWAKSSLEDINLENNPISKINSLLNLKRLKSVKLSQSTIATLNIPTDIAAEGNMERIRAYYQSFKEEIQERSIGIDPDDSHIGGDIIGAGGNIHNIGSNSVAANLLPPDDRLSAEIKLILVGNSSAGKTSLAKMLMGEDFPKTHDSTHGISIRRWQPSPSDLNLPLNTPLTVNIWDFGGQEYYHGTHRLFLNNNAIYVLLFDSETNTPSVSPPTDAQRDEFFHYRYWLDNIRFFAPDSPIVVIKNKIDLDPQNKVRFEGKDRDIYGIDNVHELSLQAVANAEPRATRRYQRFLDELLELVVERTTRAPWTLPWVKTRQYLQDNLNDLRTIEDNPFAKWRSEIPIVDLAVFEETYLKIHKELTPNVASDFNYRLDTLNLLTLLHMSGNILYYEKDPELTNRVFLNPSWVTGHIYKVLNNNVLKAKGRFTRQDVVAQVGEVCADDFVKIMQRFEIIFELNAPEATAFVAPQYLPLTPPMPDLFKIATTGLARDNSFFVRMPLFSYRKLIHRLILHYGSEIVLTPIFWKNGILLIHDGNQRILIRGEQKMDLLNDPFGEISVSIEPIGDIQKSMETVFMTFQALMKKEFVRDETPTSDPFSRYNQAMSKYLSNLKLSLNGYDFVELQTLQNQNFQILVPSDSGKQLKINDFRPFIKRNDIQRPLTVFVSYAHEDSALMSRLNVHLSPLRRTNKIETWTDKALLAGDNWDATIKKQLLEADIIIMLLSADFIASRYIWEVEIKHALERQNAKKTRVIPVLFRDCYYKDLSFAETQVIPFNDKKKIIAVRSWLNGNEDEALSIVASEINRVVEDMMKIVG